MATVLEAIIKPAFISLGVSQPGDTLDTVYYTDAFQTLQQLMSGWSVEQVMSYVVYHQGFTLAAGTQAYTVGTGGTLVSTALPIRVTGWQSVSGNFSNGGKIMSFEEFHATVKDGLASRSVLASAVCADQATPSINIRVHPTPDTSPATLFLDYYAAIPAFATTGDTVALPSGWEQALRFNLAVALSSTYARVSQARLEEIASSAQNAKAAIVQKNAAIMGLQQAA